jgi:rhamnose transport system permease protein
VSAVPILRSAEKRGGVSRIAGRLARFREAGITALLVVLLVSVGLAVPRFWSISNIQIIALSIALLLVVSVGETVVILGRNFDLTVGSTVGLAAMTAGMIFKSDSALPTVVAIVIAVGVGLAVGTVNGLMIAHLKVSSVVLTLGMLSVISGATYLVAGGNQVNPYNVPQRFVELSINSPIGVPVIVIIAIVFAVLVELGLRWSRFGRSLFAFGSNPDAAQMRGLSARRLIIASFALSGGAAGLGGAMYLSQYGLVQDTAGAGIELQAITIAVVGGVSVFGGSGSVLGTAIASVLLGSMANGIAVLGFSSFWQDAMYGMLLILAVVANAVSHRVQGSRALVRPELKL